VGLGNHRWNGIFLTEVPAAVVHGDRGDLIGRKWHFFMTTHLNYTAFAGNYLIKNPAIFQRDRHYLISRPGLAVPAEILCPFDRDWS